MRLRLALASFLVLASMAQGAPAGESPAERDARLQWWRDARFGLFIHWGLYALPAGQWHGKAVPGNGEWIMNKAEIPMADYAALAPRFNPANFDARIWARIAKNAGMKYVVITAKHHDGFAMYPSKVSPFNIADATPFKRDPLKELSDACAAEGLKFGFYYSQSQDWHHRGGNGNSWDPAHDGNFDEYLNSIAVPQVKELLSTYRPAVLWYDTPRLMDDERAARFLPLHALSPGLITNNRLRNIDPRDGSTLGDTETPEQFIPACGYPGRDWETCMTMNDTWGFKSDDHNWKSARSLLRNLSDIASKGGNYLLNVGPTADGQIPPASVERLQIIGQWLRTNGDAIYGTQSAPWPHCPAWGRITQRRRADGGATLYLHVWEWPADNRLILPGTHDRPTAAHMLAGPARVTTDDSPDGLSVLLPPKQGDSPVDIVVLEFAGPVTTTQKLPTVNPADGRITLLATDAEVHGAEGEKPLIAGSGELACITHLSRPKWNAQYCFTTPAENVWLVSVEISNRSYMRLTAAASGPFGRSVTAAVSAWARGPGEFTTADLGYVRIPAGVNSIELRSEMDDVRPLEIRRVWLTPVK